MNDVALDLLDNLSKIGATIEATGNGLILCAGPTAIPAALVARIREARTDLVATLVSRNQNAGLQLRQPQSENDRTDCESDLLRLEVSIVEWLNAHPAPSPPGRCAWCRKSELPGAIVLPFGAEPGTHVWLHAECWPAWHQARRVEAVEALREKAVAAEIANPRHDPTSH